MCLSAFSCVLLSLLALLHGHTEAIKDFPSLDVLRPSTSAATRKAAVQGLIRRVLPGRVKDIDVTIDPSLSQKGLDTFKLSTSGGRLQITGSTGVVAALGLGYYLTQYCGCQFTWAGAQLSLPTTLPAIPAPGVTVTTNDRFRYYQNVCTVSYTFAWWNLTQWERELDWMALNGINLPLAFNGQEAIWQRVYLKMGFTQKEIDAHFGGPAFLAWARMGNVQGWGGPLPQSWHIQQVALQHFILKRMRAFGMIPVLPAFAGHVPDSFTRLFPSAKVSKLSDWGGFNSTYCCTSLLDLDDPMFSKVGGAFLTEYQKEFGTDHAYNTDTFNEMTPKSSEPSYLASAGKAVFAAMTVADPKAIWIMQGWLFENEPKFWGVNQTRALLTSVPLGRMIILDLFSELLPQYNRFESYYGQPFIWCMLLNFGGTLAMYGILDSVNKGPFDGRMYANSTMVGLGLTMEGIHQNEVMYEFMNENAWRKAPVDVSKWVSGYALRRYGKTTTDIDKAWQILKRTTYNCTDGIKHHSKNMIVRRPSRNAKTNMSVYNCSVPRYADHGKDVIIISRPQFLIPLNPTVWYKPEDLFQAWDLFIKAAPVLNGSALFRYDLVDVTRQSLEVISIGLYHNVLNAYKKKDVNTLRAAIGTMKNVFTSLDTVLATDPHFLLGNWLHDAKRWGTNDQEKALYEYNARTQLTLWGPKGEILDYANKQWAGMISHYYKPRWDLFMDSLLASLLTGTSFNEKFFQNLVFMNVEEPFTFATNLFPTDTKGDAMSECIRVHQTFRPITKQLEAAKFYSKLPEAAAIQQGSNAAGHRAYSSFIQESMQKIEEVSRLKYSYSSVMSPEDVVNKFVSRKL